MIVPTREAVHEAAHAVVAEAVGLPVDAIVLTDGTNGIGGVCSHGYGADEDEGPFEVPADVQDLPLPMWPDGLRNRVERIALVVAAGTEGERLAWRLKADQHLAASPLPPAAEPRTVATLRATVTARDADISHDDEQLQHLAWLLSADPAVQVRLTRLWESEAARLVAQRTRQVVAIATELVAAGGMTGDRVRQLCAGRPADAH